MSEAFVVRTIRWKPAGLGLLSLGFVALGLFLAGIWGGSSSSSAAKAIGWLCVSLFGVFAAIWLRRLLRPEILYRLESGGIYDGPMNSFVPWEAIRSAAIYTTRSGRWPLYFHQKHLVYDVDPEQFEPPSKWQHWLHDLNYGYSTHFHVLKHTGTDRNLAALVDGFNQFAPAQLRVEFDCRVPRQRMPNGRSTL